MLRYFWEQMLEAVQQIHDKNIVHCDLKPANFLMVQGESSQFYANTQFDTDYRYFF